MSLGKSLVDGLLLTILLMPSPRILDPERTHRRHATCEHHLRRHHPDPEDRARVIRRAEHRRRLLEEEARLALERHRAAQDHEAAMRLAETFDEANLQPCQAAADPPDDDSRLKKKRRSVKVKTLFWSLQDPPRIRPTGEFLAMVRAHIESNRVHALSTADVLTHYGSGPCHSIPRAREDVVPPLESPSTVAA